MSKPKFLRSDTVRHLRLGKKKQTLQKWRKARGRHSKIRRKRFGYPVQPGIGYKQPSAFSGQIKGKKPALINSMKEIDKMNKGDIAILSRRLGAKKRIEIMQRAHALHLIVHNAGANHES